MKLTIQQAQDALRAVGVVNAEIVNEEADSTFENDAFIAAIDESRKDILIPKIRADLREEVEKSIGGKVGKQLEAALKKKLGIDGKLFTDDMKDDQKIQAAVDAFMANSQKGTADLQQELASLTTRLAKEKEDAISEYETKLAAANERYIARDEEAYYLGKLGKMPLLDNVDKGWWASQVRAHLKNTYHAVYDEATKTVKYFKKDQPTVPALNAAENMQFNDEEEIKTLLTKAGVWQTDMRRREPQQQQGLSGETQLGNETFANNNAQSVDALNKQRGDYLSEKLATGS